MFNKRDNIKKKGVSLLRLLLAVTMVQYLFAGTLLSQAAPVAEPNTVSDLELLQSADKSSWRKYPAIWTRFTMALDPTVPFFYLNVANLAADPLVEVAITSLSAPPLSLVGLVGCSEGGNAGARGGAGSDVPDHHRRPAHLLPEGDH